MVLAEGTKLSRRLGRYEVVGRVASGGMAEILLARVCGPHGFVRVVVLKRILPHLSARTDFRDMFLDEARIVSGIHHENVVHVHELGDHDDELFLVMEYLRGESATGLLRRMLHLDRTVPCALAAYAVAEACTGLNAAHKLCDADGQLLGLVHRDVSPHNVFITYDGGVKLLDFGIAHAAGRSTDTAAGQVKGKFGYMSPEQCRGKPLDRRSDIFTLGIVLYEMSTSRRLFQRASDLAIMRAICAEPIPPPSAVVDDYPSALERIVMRALSRSRDDRYSTAGEMAAELREAVRSMSTADPRETLATLMQDVFEERVAQKEAAVRALRSNERPGKIAAGDVDQHVVIPAAQDQPLGAEGTDATGLSFGERRPPRSHRRPWVMAASGAALLGLLVVTYSLRRPVDTALGGDLGSVAPATAAPIGSIVISFDTEPEGAEVVLGDEVIGTTPMQHARSASPERATFLIRREGFIERRETLTLDVSQRVRLSLTPESVPLAPGSASASPVPGTPVPRPRSWPIPGAPQPSTPKPAASGIYKL